MTAANIDRDMLKSVLKEIFYEEPEILKSALIEFLDEKKRSLNAWMMNISAKLRNS